MLRSCRTYDMCLWPPRVCCVSQFEQATASRPSVAPPSTKHQPRHCSSRNSSGSRNEDLLTNQRVVNPPSLPTCRRSTSIVYMPYIIAYICSASIVNLPPPCSTKHLLKPSCVPYLPGLLLIFHNYLEFLVLTYETSIDNIATRNSKCVLRARVQHMSKTPPSTG